MTNPNALITVLFLEDVAQDAELLYEKLVDEGYLVQKDIAIGEREYLSFLKERNYDLIIADYIIRQVWVNLITNAVKFSRKKEKPTLHIQSIPENSQTVYFVRDNGEGFNPKYKNRLFIAFQRLHSVEEFEGTGIGLALVARIIQKHGGTV